MLEPVDHAAAPVSVEEVYKALILHGMSHELAWWLATLDRRVWELSQRVEVLGREEDGDEG
jgi:hypothetical protein